MTATSSPSRPKRRVKPDAEIVLLCNPRAGGRWKELGKIFDSEEARFARRIVTDSVEDIAPAIASLGQDAKLLCIYGGDGTIQRILDRLSVAMKGKELHLALIGGGTMNVTSRWCGMSGSPADNFGQVVRDYRSGDLLLKEVPLIEVRQDDQVQRGFTFGMGPIVRILDAYERGRKGKAAAAGLALGAVSAVWTGFPRRISELTAPMRARVVLDGEELPYDDFSVLLGNVTGRINPGVAPFVDQRTRNDFYCAAYAVTARELALLLPMVVRGWLPIDRASLLRPRATIRQVTNSTRPSDITFPADPRYINRTAHTLEIESDESLYTVDGEVLPSNGSPLHVGLGPHIKLAVSRSARTGHRLVRPVKPMPEEAGAESGAEA
ncbi:diacylglycerol kinase family protein [Haliangium sp.]|uniref:diacylglycerol kinase family protein n=1 Tax=Haliangium sp. TaxID=2663208 RepID=UPI003D0C2BB2